MELSQLHLHLAIERQRRLARVHVTNKRYHHTERHPKWR